MSKQALLRITQTNASYFDNEIYKIFSEHIHDCLKYLPPGFSGRFNNELNLLLRLAILNYSIVKGDSTFGQKLLSIKYDNLTTIKKCFYVVFSCLDYLKIKIEDNTETSTIKTAISRIYAFIQLCRFLNVSVFLKTGTRPDLIHRVLSLDQVYAKENVQRIYDTQYMTRELLWDSFIELLVYILPLINYHKVKRTVKYLNPFHKKPAYSTIDSRVYTLNTRCPHCGEYPILPHHMGCAHVFCYNCLKGNQIADSRYECPTCEYSSYNSMCERVTLAA